ncbi:MAG: hypothetical protein OEQ53_12685, partial [Saprospiraceae bacterium]|nr:hypothetical protein [Saprospiraceae bacterium]
FQSYTYRYGESDWKSIRQINNLIPGGLYPKQELIEMLLSDPEKYIIPSNGNYIRIGGHNKETGGFFYDDNGSALPGHDGAFVPGVIQVKGEETPNNYSDDEFIEHLYPTENTLYPITDTYPWDFNQAITFDADFLKLRELTISYLLPDIKGIRSASVSIFMRDLMLWNKAKIGIDPERAFEANSRAQGDTQLQFRQGLERQNIMPFSNSVGIKLDLSL